MTALVRSESCDKRYYGVVEGIVVDVNDPDKEGRIKVKMPFFDDETVTEWCRVRQLYAGPGYGTFFVPEVGDEVLISFVHGDLRLPVIMGGLYNGEDKPPTHRADDLDQKMIRTRAGHQITMDDTPGEHRVTVETVAGHVVDMNDKDKVVSATTTDGHELRLDDQGKEISCVTSGGHQVVMSDSGKQIDIKTSGGESITLAVSGSTITIKGATVTVDASSILLGGMGASEPVVLGNMMMLLFNTHVHTTTAPGSPTSPPITPMTPAQLSVVTKTV